MPSKLPEKEGEPSPEATDRVGSEPEERPTVPDESREVPRDPEVEATSDPPSALSNSTEAPTELPATPAGPPGSLPELQAPPEFSVPTPEPTLPLAGSTTIPPGPPAPVAELPPPTPAHAAIETGAKGRRHWWKSAGTWFVAAVGLIAGIVTILGGLPESVETLHQLQRWFAGAPAFEEVPVETGSASPQAGSDQPEEEPDLVESRESLQRPADSAAVAVETHLPEPSKTGGARKDNSTPENRSPSRLSASYWPSGTRAGEPRRNSKDGLYYLWVPGGSFRFGCSPGDDLCEDDEKPAVPQTIENGFWMGRTEVTVRAYAKAGGHLPAASSVNTGGRAEALPVSRVTRPQAERFCESVATRLPTEIEWEYAARAGEKRALPVEIDTVAWHANNSNGRIHSVSQKAPNAFGLYDMLGNAVEWVRPAPGRDPSEGVLRGGSWLHERQFVRYSFRLIDSPSQWDELYGFRCLAAAAPTS